MNYQMPCNIAQTLNIIGDKWTLLILHQIMMGHETYNEMKEGLIGIPSNLLSERLKSLESEGLIVNELYQEHPPRYRYLLTESGEDLSDVFNSLILWGERHLKKCYKRLVHRDCKTSVALQYYCSHCEKIAEKSELAVESAENQQ